MPKLEWDKTGERFYETGLSKGVLYPQVDSAYPHGYVWNGLTSVTESPSGAEVSDLWADDMKYASLRSTETFGATVEAYMYPDEFAACDGSLSPVEGVRIGQQKRNPFGMSYVTKIGNDTASEEDDGYLIHLIWGATASPSEKQYQTVNDSPEAITFSWELTTTPVKINGVADAKPTASMTIDSRKFDTQQKKALLTALEDKLYGTAGSGGSTGTDAYLPLPDEVLTTLGYVAPAN